MALTALRERLGADSPTASAEPVAIAVGSDASGLWGMPLDATGDERPWRHEAAVTQPPVVDGDITVFGDGPRLAALESRTGERLWSIDSGGAELLAVAGSSASSALLLFDPRRERRWLSLVDGSGAEQTRIDAESDLGIPAVWRGHWLVPWGRSFVSALDAAGVEVGRARLDSVASEAARHGGDVLFAGPPWVALSTGTTIELPRRPLPGRIAVSPELPHPSDSALTRLYVLRGAAQGSPPTFMATFARFAIGFDGATGSLLWVQVLPGRALAGAVLAEGFALCDASGSVRILAPHSGHGAARARLAPARRPGLHEPTLEACALSPGSIGARASALRSDAAETPDAATEPDASALVSQLARASSLSDPDLVDAQRFLSRELAARPEPEATRALIDLATRRSTDRVLQAEAEDLLATRRNGVEFMLDALSGGSSRERDPIALPPLGALADALSALEEQRAAPLLAAQLNRPGHSADALWRAATALERLATPNEYEELSVFFSLRRTTADNPDMVRAATAAARTLLRVGGARGAKLVAVGERDKLTVPALREALAAELEKAKGSSSP